MLHPLVYKLYSVIQLRTQTLGLFLNLSKPEEQLSHVIHSTL